MQDVIYNVTIFGLELKIKPVAFTIPIGGGWQIYWYGILIALGFLLALVYGIKNAHRFNINVDRMLDVVLVTTPVAILCARLYYILFDGEKIGGFSEFFGFGDSSGFSGLAIYGGVIGAAVCGFVMCKVRKVKFADILDLAALGFLIGQGIGRWGNFVNQEAFGGLTGSSWWGMQSENTLYDVGEGLVHPCFLYESVWCIAGFFVLHYISKKRKFSGQIALLYGVWYGFGRAIIETLRTDSLMIGKIRVSCLLSVFLCLACAAAVYFLSRRVAVGAHDSEYGEQFTAQTEGENAVSEGTDNAQTEEVADIKEEPQGDIQEEQDV